MTGPNHYQAAERAIDAAQAKGDTLTVGLLFLEAIAHAALAQAAATAIGSGLMEVGGPGPGMDGDSRLDWDAVLS